MKNTLIYEKWTTELMIEYAKYDPIYTSLMYDLHFIWLDLLLLNNIYLTLYWLMNTAVIIF